MWLLPFLLIAIPVVLAVPLSRYLAWVMGGTINLYGSS